MTVKEIADAADVIIDGYAVELLDRGVRITNHLYFTSHCVVEAMHAHASDERLTESGSAKFFVKSDGDTVIQQRGMLNDRDLRRIQRFIKDHYEIMYAKWCLFSREGYYEGD